MASGGDPDHHTWSNAGNSSIRNSLGSSGRLAPSDGFASWLPARWPRSHTVGELLRFGVSTGASAAMSLGLPIFLHEALGIAQAVAVAISQSAVLVVNFLMIRIFVFRSKRSGRRDLGVYVGSAIFFRTGEYLLFLLFSEKLRIYYIAALVLTLATSTLVKFFWYRFLFGSAGANAAGKVSQF